MFGQNLGHKVKSKKLSSILMKPGQNIDLGYISNIFLNPVILGQKVGYEVRSLKGIMCVFRDHNFSPIHMKCYKNMCLDDMSQEFENG